MTLFTGCLRGVSVVMSVTLYIRHIFLCAIKHNLYLLHKLSLNKYTVCWEKMKIQVFLQKSTLKFIIISSRNNMYTAT